MSTFESNSDILRKGLSSHVKDDPRFFGDPMRKNIDFVRHNAGAIMDMRKGITSKAYANILEASVEGFKEYLSKKQRVKKYKNEIIHVPVLQEIDSTGKEVGERGVPMPFLEDRVVEGSRNHNVKKVDDRKTKIVYIEKKIKVEIPPDPIEINVSIPADLIHSFHHPDYHKNMKHVFDLLDALQLLINEEVQFNVYIIRGKDYRVNTTEKKIESYNMKINPEIYTVHSDESIPDEAIHLDVTKYTSDGFEVSSFLDYKKGDNYSYIDLSGFMGDVNIAATNRLMIILDNYFKS